jgi:ribonuclease D
MGKELLQKTSNSRSVYRNPNQAKKSNSPNEKELTLKTEKQNQKSFDLPLIKYEGPIKIVPEFDYQKAVDALMNERFLGFDTETKPSFQKGEKYLPALIQLAGENTVYIFQLKHLKHYGPLSLILADPFILKIGVAVHDDIKKLQELIDFIPSGFIDISEVTMKAGLGSMGVKTLAAHFLNSRISKSVRCSNWDSDVLKNKQIEYAATDAWIPRVAYLMINKYS